MKAYSNVFFMLSRYCVSVENIPLYAGQYNIVLYVIVELADKRNPSSEFNEAKEIDLFPNRHFEFFVTEGKAQV